MPKTMADLIRARFVPINKPLAPECSKRIANLPARIDPSDEQIDELTRSLTHANNTNNNNARLRPEQASALIELRDYGGLFAPLAVGGGKTLLTLLAPTVTQAERPVLIIPASLRQKTIDECREYAKTWRVRLPTILGYEELGRPDRADRLSDIKPDLLIFDEAHRLKNKSSAVCRRIKRVILECMPKVAVMSGSMYTDDPLDYHHIALWALKDKAPVPYVATQDQDDAHFLSRRGVVPTSPVGECTSEIIARRLVYELPKLLQDMIADVQLTKQRPDGELLTDLEIPDVLCQLALGYYLHWSPLPPRWWLLPRRAWNAYVQGVLDEHHERFDSPSQITQSLDHDDNPPAILCPDLGRRLLAKWRGVRDLFTPNSVPVWLSTSPLEAFLPLAAPTLVWYKNKAVGEKLEALGLKCYNDQRPEGHPPAQSMGLSIAANATGRNLQAWHRNLILHPPASASMWEQLIGRTHRPGQKSPQVFVDVYAPTWYHQQVLKRVQAKAARIGRASGNQQKIGKAQWQ